MDFRSVPQLRVVLTKENTGTLESASDRSSPKRKNRHLRSRPPPARKQKKETDPRRIKKKVVTAQTVVQKKINSDHLLSVDHNVPEPKEMHHATCQYSASQPKVVVRRIKPEVLQSLSDHCKSSKYPRAHHSASLLVEDEETEPPSRMEKLEAREERNGHGLPSSDDDDDDVHHATCQYSASQPKVVVRRIKPEVLQSLSDHCKSSKYPRAHHSASPLVEDEETEPPSRMEKLEAQEERNGHGLPSSDDDVHHATCQYSSSQPKVVVRRIKPEILRSLSDHCDSSKYPRAHHSASPLVEDEETEPPSRMEKLEAQEERNGHGLPSSDNDDDDVHHATCQYSSSQPKVVVRRIKPEILQSLSDHCESSKYPRAHHSASPLVEDEETEPPSRMGKLEAQEERNGHGLPSSDNDDVHHAACQYISSQPKVVLTKINPEVFQSLLDNSDNSSECPRAHHPPVSPLVEKETELPSRLKELQTREMINGHGLPSSEDDDVHQTTCHSSTSQPKVVLTRVNTQLLGSLPDHDSPDSSKYMQAHPPSPPSVMKTETEQLPRSEKPLVHLRARKPICYNISSSEDEHEPQSRRAVRKDSTESVTSFSKESDSSHEFSKPNTTSQPEVIELLDSVSDDNSPHWKKRLRVRPPTIPSREILIETDPPIRREKPAVRLVTQKKINYCASSSSEEEENEKCTYNAHRRKAVGKDSESDATFSDQSESSDEVRNPKIRRRYQRKKVTESQLKKEAIRSRNRSLSEYEKQRMKNIEQKLAFLESLQKLGDVVNAGSFKDN